MDLLSSLNPAQQQAVQLVDGPVLVLAGPGSGKTRVLTHRVAYLIQQAHISPYQILAVTFTNKAARAMRERLTNIVGEEHVRDLTIGTFHATCARFLRRDGERLGLGRGFAIYDEDDQLTLMKRIVKEMNLDDKKYRPGMVLGAIGKAKNELIGPAEYVPPSYWHEAVGRAYNRYQQLLAENNAVDFDDLLMQTVRLFRENADILERYQERYRYLHVDEFQDTNIAQYVLMKQLAERYQNLFCVGDEDQSIYGWRGADYRNVLRFRDDFPNAQVALLEQNYRSTQTILDVAQAVIRKNKSRHKKNLWTENPAGVPIVLREAYNEEEEAQFVVDEIARLTRQGYQPRDCAVFYRTNAQSRSLEDCFVRRGMPYQLVGSVRFYQRREVKDLLAYLRLVNNPNDSVAFGRVLNVPPRGIGKKTIDELALWVDRLSASPYQVLQLLKEQEDHSGRKSEGQAAAARPASPIPATAFDARTRKVLLAFLKTLDTLLDVHAKKNIVDLFDLILLNAAYEPYVRDGTEEGEDRWDNVQELRKAIRKYAGAPPDVALVQFLEEVSLVADIDAMNEELNAPILMTLHTAKGLEYPVVFIIGLEEGLFPHSRSFEDPAQMEEERRLCYVGITRAKERLYLVNAFRRSHYGSSEPGEPSRFLADIPREMIAGASAAARTAGRERLSREGEEDDRPTRRPSTIGEPDPQTFRRSESTPLRRSTVDDADDARPSHPRVEAAQRRRLQPEPNLEFKAGDRVQHASFGDGVVVSSKASGADEEVEVAFVGKGVKRLIARYAGLKKK
jgi:DNA helicase-2/ATP-dependent DNA helicase PcrA